MSKLNQQFERVCACVQASEKDWVKAAKRTKRVCGCQQACGAGAQLGHPSTYKHCTVYRRSPQDVASAGSLKRKAAMSTHEANALFSCLAPMVVFAHVFQVGAAQSNVHTPHSCSCRRDHAPSPVFVNHPVRGPPVPPTPPRVGGGMGAASAGVFTGLVDGTGGANAACLLPAAAAAVAVAVAVVLGAR